MLNGMKVIKRTPEAVYLRIPDSLQIGTDVCSCPFCKDPKNPIALKYRWDTLAVPIIQTEQYEHAWTVHMPDPSFPPRFPRWKMICLMTC